MTGDVCREGWSRSSSSEDTPSLHSAYAVSLLRQNTQNHAHNNKHNNKNTQ
eukprot:c40860_g1_i1 orf=3-152(-)